MPAKVWSPCRVYNRHRPLLESWDQTVWLIVNNCLVERPGGVNLKDFKCTLWLWVAKLSIPTALTLRATFEFDICALHLKSWPKFSFLAGSSPETVWLGPFTHQLIETERWIWFPPKSYISIRVQTFPIYSRPSREIGIGPIVREAASSAFIRRYQSQWVCTCGRSRPHQPADWHKGASRRLTRSERQNQSIMNSSERTLIHRSSGERRRSTMLMKARRRRRQAYLVIRPVGSFGEKKGMNHSPSSSSSPSTVPLVISAPSRRRNIKVRAHSEAPPGGGSIQRYLVKYWIISTSKYKI